jgi:TolA-binding protein
MAIEIDVHPDDLLHRTRHARPLSRHEQLHLDAHLRDCSTCRFIRDAGVAFDAEAQASESAPAQVDALVERTMLGLRGPARARRALPRRFAAGAMTVVAMIGGVAFAGYWGTRHPSPAHEAVVTRAVPAPAAPRHRAAADAAPAPMPAAAAPPAAVPAPRRLAMARRPEEIETAARLFARANRARRQGDVTAAETAYAALWSRFRTSAEALASRAIAGQWLLDRGKPRSAIALFRQYLAAASQGELQEDVLVGLADAHAALGDRAAADAAWRRLLAEHPGSVHAERAREGLRRSQPGTAP